MEFKPIEPIGSLLDISRNRRRSARHGQGLDQADAERVFCDKYVPT